jgi:predicted Zn-dependent peptidase
MPGFVQAHALLTARLGSLDTALPDGTPIPDGTAHFLEHKMFATPEGDAFDLYDARGASANAFTTFTHTTYLFSSTHRFEENLDTLLTTLGSMDADEAGIAREQGIIGQEIAMYADDPGWQGTFRLLAALYHRHPVRRDIAGSPRSIARLDRPFLERVHAAYYGPRNLVLVVAGDVDPEEVRARAEAGLPAGGPPRRPRPPVAEPPGVRRAAVAVRLSVSRPHVLVGMKEPGPGPGLRLLRRQVESALVLDVLFGDGGLIEAPLHDEGLVDDTLAAGYECEADFAHAVVSAEVDAVAPFRRRLEEALAGAARRGLSEADVARARKRFLGLHVAVFNSPERVAHALLGSAIAGLAPGAALDALLAATPAALTRRLRAIVAAPRAWSVVAPRR